MFSCLNVWRLIVISIEIIQVIHHHANQCDCFLGHNHVELLAADYLFNLGQCTCSCRQLEWFIYKQCAPKHDYH